MKNDAPKLADRTFHPIKREYLDTMIGKSKLTAKERTTLETFIQVKKADDDIGLSREKKIIESVAVFRFYSDVSFDDMTMSHITAIRNKLKDSKRFKRNTYRDILAVNKMYLNWLIDNGHNTHLTEKDLKKIKLPSAYIHSVTHADLLAPEDIQKMISAAGSLRDKAIISLMAEAGLRPVEIGRMQYGDLEFTQNSMNVWVRQKTERQRKIPAPLSKPYVQQWINNAPYKMQSDSIVFPSLTPKVLPDGTRQYQPLRDDALRQQLQVIAKLAEVRNYKKPYQFRHTAITRLTNAGLPQAKVMQLSHGGDSRMMKIYYHVCDREIEDDILTISGLKKKQESEPIKPTHHYCEGCGQISPLEFDFCPYCQAALSEKAKEHIKSREEELMEIVKKVMAASSTHP